MPAGRTFVIAGASLAGATAAGELRARGFDGRLVLLGSEDALPYQRPALSKGYLRGEVDADALLVRPEDWYRDNEVELRPGTTAVQLDVRERALVLAGGERLSFDALLIATGSRNRKLDVPGAGLPGVFDLRRIGDADRIRAAAAPGARVVCVGMGFIGAEVAASMRMRGHEVTVVEVFETALFRVLGRGIGRALEAVHRDHGVVMHFNDTVARFEGDGRLERVVTTGGRTIDADVAVVGVGTEPAAEIVAGTALDRPGGIPVGASLETEIPGVFAAGDVALHDHPVFGPIRVEHFDNGVKMGETAARNMLGAGLVHGDPHWFWSDQYDSQVQMAGFAPAWDRMIVRGSPADRSFCAFLLDGSGLLRGTVSLDWQRDVRRSLALIGTAPDPAALADPGFDLRSLVQGP